MSYLTDDAIAAAAEERYERQLRAEHFNGEHEERIDECSLCDWPDTVQFGHPCQECGAGAGVPCACGDVPQRPSGRRETCVHEVPPHVYCVKCDA